MGTVKQYDEEFKKNNFVDFVTDIKVGDLVHKYRDAQDCVGELLLKYDNAEQMNKSFKDEFHRVLAHGVLHLIGFKDKTDAERKDHPSPAQEPPVQIQQGAQDEELKDVGAFSHYNDIEKGEDSPQEFQHRSALGAGFLSGGEGVGVDEPEPEPRGRQGQQRLPSRFHVPASPLVSL